MRLKIVQAGEPALRQTAGLLAPQEILTEEIQRRIRDIQKTMRDATGVGLAAPQPLVCRSLRLIRALFPINYDVGEGFHLLQLRAELQKQKVHARGRETKQRWAGCTQRANPILSIAAIVASNPGDLG
jgi:hypothetical protein